MCLLVVWMLGSRVPVTRWEIPGLCSLASLHTGSNLLAALISEHARSPDFRMVAGSTRENHDPQFRLAGGVMMVDAAPCRRDAFRARAHVRGTEGYTEGAATGSSQNRVRAAMSTVRASSGA